MIAGQVRAPAPGQAEGDRSLIISPAPLLWGGLHVAVRTSSDPLVAKDHVLLALGIPPAPPGRRPCSRPETARGPQSSRSWARQTHPR